MNKFINIKDKLFESFQVEPYLFDSPNCKNNKNDQYGIYIHLNKINNKMYCGQTKQTFTERWGSNGCCYTIKKKNGKDPKQLKFANAIKKYGWDNFEHIIIAENISKELADIIEIFIIDNFNLLDDNNGYNIASGGHSKAVSEHMRKKMSENHLKRKVVGISIEDKSIYKFDSIKDANNFINAKNPLVNACIKKGNGSSSRGYIWMYLEDFDDKKIEYYILQNKEMQIERYNFIKTKEYKEKRRNQMLKLNKNGEISRNRDISISFKKIVRIDPNTKEYIIFNSKTEGAKSVNGSVGAISTASKSGKLSLLKNYIWVNYDEFERLGLDLILNKYQKGELLWS